MSVGHSDGNFPLKLFLPDQGIKKEFKTTQEVSDFLQEEVNYWAELDGLVEDQLTPSLERMWRASGRDLLGGSNTSLQSAEEAITRLETLSSNPPILKYGRHGTSLTKLAKEKPLVAVGMATSAAAAYSGDLHPFNNLGRNNPNYIDLISLSAGSLAAGASRASDRKAEVDRLTEQLSELISESQELWTNVENWSDSAKAKWEETLQQYLESFEKFANSQEQRLAKEINNAWEEFEAAQRKSNERILELEKTVKERMLLEAPTKYWTDRGNSHRNAAIAFSLLFTGIVAAGVHFLIHDGADFLATTVGKVVAVSGSEGLSALLPLAFITLPALAIAWVLRHLSRLIIQNITLGADARLRGTIAQTYMAITHDKEPSDVQLAIALQALFRPIDSKDHAEIAPPNIEEILKMGK